MLSISVIPHKPSTSKVCFSVTGRYRPPRNVRKRRRPRSVISVLGTSMRASLPGSAFSGHLMSSSISFFLSFFSLFISSHILRYISFKKLLLLNPYLRRFPNAGARAFRTRHQWQREHLAEIATTTTVKAARLRWRRPERRGERSPRHSWGMERAMWFDQKVAPDQDTGRNGYLVREREKATDRFRADNNSISSLYDPYEKGTHTRDANVLSPVRHSARENKSLQHFFLHMPMFVR